MQVGVGGALKRRCCPPASQPALLHTSVPSPAFLVLQLRGIQLLCGPGGAQGGVQLRGRCLECGHNHIHPAVRWVYWLGSGSGSGSGSS